MIPYFFLIFRTASVGVGIFLITTRVFTFEKTQGVIQSHIESLWISVDDYQRAALSRHVSFIKVVSGLLTSVLNRVFGRRLISLQSLTVSVCFAVASCLAFVLLLFRKGLGYWDKTLVMIFVLYLGVGSFPTLISFAGRAKRKKYLLIWLTYCLTSAYLMIVMPSFDIWKEIHYSEIRWVETFILGLYLCVLIALLFFAFFIGLIRKSLRAIQNAESILKTGGLLFLNLLPIASAYGLIKLLLFKLEHSQFDPSLNYKDPLVIQTAFANWSTRVDMFLVFLFVAFCLFDVVFIFTAVAFGLLSLLMFLHRLFWPVLSRLLYASQRFRIISDGKILIYIGALFILLGIGKISWLKALL